MLSFLPPKEIDLAEYPCDWHLARYTGPSTRIYLNGYRDAEEFRLKGSICGDCLADIVTAFMSRALHEDSDGDWMVGTEETTLEELWKPARTSIDPRFRRRIA